MKKHRLLILLCMMFFFSSCTDNSNEQINIDFGETKYNEPFVGIFKSRPSWLEATLDWPVIRWFKPDTAIVSRTVEIEFNEDAVRSGSLATINLVDSNFNNVQNVQWYCNERPIADSKFVVKASLESQQFKIKAKIHPSIGDTMCYGFMDVSSEDLDEVNAIKLSSERANSVANWKFHHKIGWPIMIWLIWISIPVLALWLLLYLLKVLARLVMAVSAAHTTHHTSSHISKKHIEKREKKKKEKRKEKKHCPCCKQMEICSPVFGSSSSSIAEKCQTLLKITDEWEYLSSTEKESTYECLCPRMKVLLESFWNIRKSTPTSNGHWIGEKGNGVFYFDEDFVPPESNNRNGMTWKELVQEYKKDFNLHVDGGIHYRNNRIDLRQYAVAIVKVKYEESNLDKLKNRGGSEDSIQEIGATLFMKDLRKTIQKEGYANFWEFKDGIKNGKFVRNTPLVIHEDYDGETLMLVPKFLHGNLKHYGGIALVSRVIMY